MPITGTCFCGAIRYSASAKHSRVHYCHCGMCRRATGGPFAVLVWLPASSIEWATRLPASRRSSPIAQRGFCASCGTPIYLKYDGAEEMGVLIGTLEHPEDFVPQYHYGTEGRLPWADCGSGLPGSPTMERF